MVTFFSWVSIIFLSTCCAVLRLISAPVREAKAINRMRAPSSSRIFDLMERAIYSATSSGICMRSLSAFFWRMAILVSRSGIWMSAIKPHSNRERKRSSMEDISLGGQSEEITICFC